MLPFEFTISQQTPIRARLQEWKAFVRATAQARWPEDHPPLAVPLQITVVYFHERERVRIDADNLLKPIQDALNGLVYVDDTQITDMRVRKTNMNGAIRPRFLSPMLATAFVRGEEFVYVRIEDAPDHQELL